MRVFVIVFSPEQVSYSVTESHFVATHATTNMALVFRSYPNGSAWRFECIYLTAGPKPVGERQRGRAGNHDELALVHLRHEHSSEEQR
jgi:hypothetical protein